MAPSFLNFNELRPLQYPGEVTQYGVIMKEKDKAKKIQNGGDCTQNERSQLGGVNSIATAKVTSILGRETRKIRN